MRFSTLLYTQNVQILMVIEGRRQKKFVKLDGFFFRLGGMGIKGYTLKIFFRDNFCIKFHPQILLYRKMRNNIF